MEGRNKRGSKIITKRRIAPEKWLVQKKRGAPLQVSSRLRISRNSLGFRTAIGLLLSHPGFPRLARGRIFPTEGDSLDVDVEHGDHARLVPWKKIEIGIRSA